MNLAKEFTAYKTILFAEAKRIVRIWTQTVLPPVITSVLYFVIFGRVIGARVGMMGNFHYIQYIAPGLIMMNIITSAYSSTISSFFQAKFHRIIEELLVSPVSNATILLGFMSVGMLRGMVVGIIVAIISMLFAHLHIYSLITIIITALMASSIFSLAALVNGIYAKTFDDISIVPTFVLTPLTYLGGVFYSIQLLPPGWRYVSLVNPIVYIIDNFRYGFLGMFDQYVMISYSLMLAFIAVLFAFGYYLLHKGIGLRS